MGWSTPRSRIELAGSCRLSFGKSRRGRQVERGRHEVEALELGAHDRVGDAGARFEQHIVRGGALPLHRVNAHAVRAVELEVHVYQQHAPARLGERGAEVDRRRGLADAALLVRYRGHPAHLRHLRG
jgi:hypothetical protein